MATNKGSVLSLTICVLGIYASFLSWSVLQERINTKPYGEKNELFKAPLIINIIQSFFAFLVGSLYLSINEKKLTNPFKIFQNNLTLLKSFLVVAITQSMSSPIGYKSLDHIDYLGFLLAKSCKLIPVILIHTVLYRSKFPLHKYLVAIAVTVGVTVFTLSNNKSKKTSSNDGQTLLGLAQLGVSLIFDGLTNSTQDQIFKASARVSGANLMSVLNCISFILTIGYTIGFTNQFQYFLDFVSRNPEVLLNILSFAVFGSIGQIFIFITLEKFDSLILVTVTVTRKMISMLISVLLFGHALNVKQWLGVALVFGGIGFEALIKMNGSKKENVSQTKKTI